MGMIEGRDIICFSNDWDGDPLSKKHIMRRFARSNRVLWINSIGNRRPTASVRDLKRVLKKVWQFARGSHRVADGVHVISPIALPFFGNALARKINQRLLRWTIGNTCRRLNFRDAITWTFLPASADVVGTLGERSIVYHCVDEYSEFSGTDRNAILNMERRLIEKSNYVIVSSERLAQSKKCAGLEPHVVTHGVDVEHFRRACDPNTIIPDDIAGLSRPVIGFFGLIADWVDLPLIAFLGRFRPEWNFVLIGEITTATACVDELPNVHLLGRKSYESLPGYCKAFDIAILPFVVNELTLAANPLKLREYVAAGLPVVATGIPEAKRLKACVRTADTPEDFLSELQMIVDSGATGPQLAVSLGMNSESWDLKLEELSRILDSAGAAV
jgi:glycosyltransferase involved in cell wall biosynthesis